MRNKILSLSILMYCHVVINLTAQSPIPIITTNHLADHETVFITKEGKVAFTLEKKYQSVIYNKRVLDIYNKGIAVVGTKDRKDKQFVWIDEKGKKVKEFVKQFYRMDPMMENGLCIAWRFTNSDKRKRGEAVVLNEEGVNAFGDKTFLDIAPFSEGLAPAKSNEGELGYIDETGKMILEVKGYTSDEIAKLHSFHNGLAKVDIKEPGKKGFSYQIFINRQGEKVLDVKERYEDFKIWTVGNYKNGILAIRYLAKDENKWKDVFLDMEGKEVIKLEDISKVTMVENGGYYLVKKELVDKAKGYYRDKHFILDPSGEVKEMTLADGNRIEEVKSIDSLIVLELANRTPVNQQGLYAVNPFRAVFITDGIIKGYKDSLVLIHHKNLNRYRLQNFDGKVLWETPIENWTIVNNLAEALKYKDKVQKYELHKEEDFDNGLYELKNLEELTIEFAKVEEIYAKLIKLRKLKKLSLDFQLTLKTFPPELGQLKNLEYLSIKGCNKYESGLEEWVIQLPKLRKLILEDLTLDKAFKAKLKKVNPKLTIKEEETMSFEDMKID